MININRFLMTVICMTLSGCNTPPSNIAPVYHGSEAYEKYDCRRLGRQLSQMDTIVSTQKSQLQSDANMDKGIVTGSILLLPLGLFALAATGNGDLKDQYAQNLGKQVALRQAMDINECEI